MTIVKKVLLALAGTAFTIVLTAPGAQAGTLVFSGVGADATKAFEDFKAAIGGQNNGAQPSQNSGFRTIGWDGVRLDGTDANPNTVVIDPGKTVAIPENRFRAQGALYAEPYAVSGDGFVSVNPDVDGQFPAFSPNNTFAMFDEESGKFDDRFIEQSFTFAGTDTPAATRGFGAIFKDVELAKTSSIEYFNGSKSLGKYYVEPSAISGDTQFLGVLFDDPVVTDVTLTVGTNAIFSFDGTTITSFGPEDLANGIDLAVTDDFVFAETTTAKKVPEPSAALGTLFVSMLGAVSLLKNKKNKAKLV
jgi:hypothetical protein